MPRDNELGGDRRSLTDLEAELAAMRVQVAHLRSENTRLLRLLELTPSQARPPGPVQTGMFDAAPGSVHGGSSPAMKVAFFAALFGARTDVYAVRWENRGSGKAGWMPAVRGGWRRGVPAGQREYLPLTAGYGLVIVDECHHVPAAAFEHAVRQIPARRWIGLTATPYRRDQLDDLIALQLGPTRHTMQQATTGTLSYRAADSVAPQPQLRLHTTDFRYTGDTDPSAPGGIATVYRELAADTSRNQQIIGDVVEAVGRGRHCLVLTQWTGHLEHLAELLRERGHDPAVLRGRMGAKARVAALSRLDPQSSETPLLVVATGSYIGEGFDCPALDALFLTAPIAFKGRLVQYVGRVMRPYPGKTTAEVHDYHDIATGVLASSLGKRASGYTSLGFPDPRRI